MSAIPEFAGASWWPIIQTDDDGIDIFPSDGQGGVTDTLASSDFADATEIQFLGIIWGEAPANAVTAEVYRNNGATLIFEFEASTGADHSGKALMFGRHGIKITPLSGADTCNISSVWSADAGATGIYYVLYRVVRRSN